MLSNASTFASQVNDTFMFILIVSVIFFLGVVIAMIYFVVRYHHKRNQEVANIHGNTTLEVLWTVIPTILVMAMFYYGFIGYRDMRTVPEGATDITATGRMWSWVYTYENGFQTDTLVVPLGKPVKVDIETADVLHSFYIPAFRVKQDAVPGMTNFVWFEAIQEGVFDILCTEYCGDRHSYMLSKVKVIPEEQYHQWYAATAGQVVNLDSGEQDDDQLAARGQKLYKMKGCIACHSTDGSRIIGPSFKGIYGHEVEVLVEGKAEKVLVDEDYIRESILQPQAKIVKGFEAVPMPPQPLTEAEIQAIIAYFKELK